jgi:DNA-binding NarL/FixJ family response regulator
MDKTTVKILIVDDHPIVRDGIKTMLELGDFDTYVFTILEAGSAEETMLMLKNNSFDLVIMDYQLEETNGAVLTKSVINLYPSQYILTLSNYEDSTYAGSMLKAGARGYVTKNLAAKGLVDAISSVLEGKIYFSLRIANELIEHRILGKSRIELNADNPSLSRLSKREVEIIKLICDQLTNDEISKMLFLSKRTIDNHRQNILNKLGMRNTAGLVRFAVENGLVTQV